MLEHKGRSRGRGREASRAPKGGKGGSLESVPAAPSSSVSCLPLNCAHRLSDAVKRTQGLALFKRLPRQVISVATILSRLLAQPNFSKRCWHTPCPHGLPSCCSGWTLLPFHQNAFARRLGTTHSLLAHSEASSLAISLPAPLTPHSAFLCIFWITPGSGSPVLCWLFSTLLGLGSCRALCLGPASLLSPPVIHSLGFKYLPRINALQSSSPCQPAFLPLGYLISISKSLLAMDLGELPSPTVLFCKSRPFQ